MENHPKFEHNDEKLYRYIYRDNSVGGAVVFECTAQDILEADKKYQNEIGQNPGKQNHVGCSIEKNEPDTRIQ